MTTILPGKPLPGVNILIQGPTGVGKTWSLGTLADAGLHLHYYNFEAGGESLRGHWTDGGKPIPPNVHFHTVATAQASWVEMADATHNVNALSYEMLKKTGDSNRGKYDQFEKFLRAFASPVDDSGEKYPSVDSWGTDRVIAVDGLTGLGVSAMATVIGGKVDKDQKDWGLAQNLVENTLRRLCDSCRCHFVLLAHIEREVDPLGGPSKITVSTLGAKLAPKIPPMFSDVALAKRLKAEFSWDTEDPQCDLKARNLPIAGKIPQDFKLILDRWKGRGGVVAP